MIPQVLYAMLKLGQAAIGALGSGSAAGTGVTFTYDLWAVAPAELDRFHARHPSAIDAEEMYLALLKRGHHAEAARLRDRAERLVARHPGACIVITGFQ